MPTDTTPWLTTRDLAHAFSLKDRRATAALAQRLGGVKIGRQWRVPPDAVDRLRITGRAQADHRPSPALPTVPPSVPDPPGVPEALGTDWWKDSA